MAKIWKEAFDAERHRDYMTTKHLAGWLPGDGRGGVDRAHSFVRPHWVYFVREGDFTFQFHSLEQVQECLDYFEAATHPSSRTPGIDLEHYWQRWFERLPAGLLSGQRRVRIGRALSRALETFKREA
jgi:hypothetical protein